MNKVILTCMFLIRQMLVKHEVIIIIIEKIERIIVTHFLNLLLDYSCLY